MIRYFLFFSFVVVIFGCSQNEKAVKTTFETFTNFENATSIVDLLDKESVVYFTKIMELAREDSELDVRGFYRKQEYPLSARYMLQSMAMVSDSSSSYTIEDAITIASLANFGPLGLENRKQFKFHELVESNKNKAIAIVNYEAAKRTYIQSKVTFHFEEEKWKLNYPSTLSYFEKYLTKLQQQSGGKDRDFIQSVIENGGQDVIMKYRQ